MDSIVYSDDQDAYVSTHVRPVSKPEAAGWSVVILGAYAISGCLLYLIYSQFFLEQPEISAFNAALDKLREDFRVTVHFGDRIKGTPISGLPSIHADRGKSLTSIGKSVWIVVYLCFCM
jgi:hypothetical protein